MLNQFFLILYFILSSNVALATDPNPIEATDHSQKSSLSILIFGDSGTGKENQFIIAEAMTKACAEHDCDFGMILGDNFYPEGVESINDPKFQTHFEIPYAPLAEQKPGFQIFTLLGNHDWKGNIKAQINYVSPTGLWQMPARYYKVPNLPDWLHIFGVDTEILTETSSFKRKYNKTFKRNLKNQNAALRKSLCPQEGWKIVAAHHPLFSTGKEKNKDEEKALRKSILKSVQDCGTHFYFSGHEHFQEHVTYGALDAIVQGAASQLRFKTSPIKVPGAESVFKSVELGFSILKVDAQQASLLFFDSDGRKIYEHHKQNQ